MPSQQKWYEFHSFRLVSAKPDMSRHQIQPLFLHATGNTILPSGANCSRNAGNMAGAAAAMMMPSTAQLRAIRRCHPHNARSRYAAQIAQLVPGALVQRLNTFYAIKLICDLCHTAL